MASATKVTKYPLGKKGSSVEKITEKSAANTLLALSTLVGKNRRFLFATVKYSAAPTQTGVTFEIDSGTGADYDALLNTGSANAQHTVYIPGDKVELQDDDVIKVTAPAAGGAITSAISIITEV
ncbi:hypothetical protein LCGC14_0665150 [marine sediment metagenome]|uniref:Uncharacterized protein n=1 Tax=marine sediment metagenome TaxID=412755 RepID=A0A0F9TDY8_9ZZZZ